MIVAGIKEEVARHKEVIQRYIEALEKFIEESPENPEITPVTKGGKLFILQSRYLRNESWSVSHYHFRHQYEAVLNYLKEKPTEIPTRLKTIINTGEVRIKIYGSQIGSWRDMYTLHPRVIERLKEL